MLVTRASGFSCLTSRNEAVVISRSSIPATYSNGTDTLRNSHLALHFSTDLRRWAKTPLNTPETVARTVSTRACEAELPTRNWRQTLSGNPNVNSKGAKTRARHLRRPRRGGDTNPAQRTKACNLAGAFAASLTAKGVENDYAKMTKGTSDGTTDSTIRES